MLFPLQYLSHALEKRGQVVQMSWIGKKRSCTNAATSRCKGSWDCSPPRVLLDDGEEQHMSNTGSSALCSRRLLLASTKSLTPSASVSSSAKRVFTRLPNGRMTVIRTGGLQCRALHY